MSSRGDCVAFLSWNFFSNRLQINSLIGRMAEEELVTKWFLIQNCTFTSCGQMSMYDPSSPEVWAEKMDGIFL